MAERRFALRRLGRGDYLWWADDLATLYRLRAYEEDGSAAWTDRAGREHRITGRYWSVYRLSARAAASQAQRGGHPSDWSGWEQLSWTHPTRAAALAAAMRTERRRGAEENPASGPDH